MYERALGLPYSKHLYLALTRDSAKRIMWDDVFKTLARDLKIPCRFNETELSIRFENGAVIYLLGADAKVEEQDKLLGQKYKTIVIDEAASFRTDLRRLIYKTLEPALVDANGILLMIGTPGDFIGPPGEDRHLFYAATSGATRGEASFENEENTRGQEWWSFRWNTFDNPHMAEKWTAALERKTLRTPHFKETVEYKTEWLGEWSVDTDKIVYHFSETRNLIEVAPEGIDRHTIGIDLGFNDATAYHVWGWRPYDDHLYGLESSKATKQDLDQVSAKINELRALYPKARLIIDGASKQAVEHLRRIYKQPLEAAEKHGKPDFIRLMNTDLVTARIKLVTSKCLPLIDEWVALIWDDKKRLQVEHDACANHCADAALYGWRDSLHFNATKQPKKSHSIYSAEAVEEWEARMIAEAVEEDDVVY
jgi:hypothetical protein